MDANRPPTLPAEAIRRWRDGLRELETLTHTERLPKHLRRAVPRYPAALRLLETAGQVPRPRHAPTVRPLDWSQTPMDREAHALESEFLAACATGWNSLARRSATLSYGRASLRYSTPMRR